MCVFCRIFVFVLYLFCDAKILQIFKTPRNKITNMDKVKERLLQFAKIQKLVMMDFYKKITVASSNFSGKGGDSALSTDKIIHILTIYPELSPDWLLLEKGEMLRKNNAKNIALASAPQSNASNGDMSIQAPAELLQLLTSQQETIKSLSRTIEHLTTTK